MSTSIYNGHIIKNCTLEEMLNRLNGIRSRCVDLAQQAMAKQIAKQRTFWLDMDQNYLPVPRQHFDPPFWRLIELLKAQEVKLASSERSTDWDFTFKVCLIPHGNDLLGLHYLEQDPGFRNVLKEIGFNDYHFQNSTDRPDSISAAEWEKREQVWDEALPNGVAADVGYSYVIVRWDDAARALWNHELILSSTPDDEYRRKQVALRLADDDIEPFDESKHHLFRYAKLAMQAAERRAPHVYLASDLSE